MFRLLATARNDCSEMLALEPRRRKLPRVSSIESLEERIVLSSISLLGDGIEVQETSEGTDQVFGDLGNDWIVGGTGRDGSDDGLGNDLLNADDTDSAQAAGRTDPYGAYNFRVNF